MSGADKAKLDGVAANANNYVHPTTDGSLHVPATGTTNNGRVLTAGATAGSISWVALTRASVGLGNVDNTSDAAKPVSTAQQNALDLKANLASPAFTGTPTAPTAAAVNNSTQIATTAWARAQLNEIHVASLGIVPNSGADISPALNPAMQTLSAQGGGTVVFPGGTFLTSGLTLPSNVFIRGAGLGTTVIKLITGSNIGAVIAGQNAYSLATGPWQSRTATLSGVFNVGIRDLTVDANKALYTVRAATTANITRSGALTIDGVALVPGDMVLVKNQTTASQNGIYFVQSGTWTRVGWVTLENDVGVYVTSGTANGAKYFLLTTPNPITVGTTAQTWAQYAGTFADGVTIFGATLYMDKVEIRNSYRNGLWVEYVTGLVPTKQNNVQSWFKDLAIHGCKDGLLYGGPTDSIFEGICVYLCSNTNIWCYGSGTGKFTDAHTWSDGVGGVQAVTGVQLDSPLNLFVNCAFEGATARQVWVRAPANMFVNCVTFYNQATPNTSVGIEVGDATGAGGPLPWVNNNSPSGITAPYGTRYDGKFLNVKYGIFFNNDGGGGDYRFDGESNKPEFGPIAGAQLLDGNNLGTNRIMGRITAGFAGAPSTVCFEPGQTTFIRGLTVQSGPLTHSAIGVYANDAQAGAAGLAAGTFYMAPDGSIRAKLPGAEVSDYTAITPAVSVTGVTTGFAATAVGRWRRVNKTVHYWGTVTMTTRGSATGQMAILLPFNVRTGTFPAGSAVNLSTFQPAMLYGIGPAIQTAIPASNGESVSFNITYEVD